MLSEKLDWRFAVCNRCFTWVHSHDALPLKCPLLLSLKYRAWPCWAYSVVRFYCSYINQTPRIYSLFRLGFSLSYYLSVFSFFLSSYKSKCPIELDEC
uniref:Uncharacterized protein n=1 Tax=Salix viminalis TaxID=40686 RepID=A0A6N2NLS2_SALVM